MFRPLEASLNAIDTCQSHSYFVQVIYMILSRWRLPLFGPLVVPDRVT